MKIAFISDIHGNYDVYREICKEHDYTIQLGDFGLGFEKWNKEETPYITPELHNHRFIRGNHDSPLKCTKHPNWIPDGTIEEIDGLKFMFVGGAWSIDAVYRKEGESWWPDEECSEEKLALYAKWFAEEKPDVMVTHDCPLYIAKKYCLGAHKPSYPNRTSRALEAMHLSHKPKLWVFGHWHLDLDFCHDGTRFLCSRATDRWNKGVHVIDTDELKLEQDNKEYIEYLNRKREEDNQIPLGDRNE